LPCNYRKIDPIIAAWVSQHSLYLCTKYQDAEVRSVEVVSPSGKRCQIWIDRPGNGTVMVHAWDFDKRKMVWEVSTNKLSGCLKNALGTVYGWAEEG